MLIDDRKQERIISKDKDYIGAVFYNHQRIGNTFTAQGKTIEIVIIETS